MRGVRWLVVGVVGLALSGCVSGGPVGPGVAERSAPEPVVASPAPVVRGPESVTRLLDAYRASPAQIVALAQAEAGLVTQCYRASGSDAVYELGAGLVDFVGDPTVSDAAFSDLWGFFSPSSVDRYGYGRVPGTGSYQEGPSRPVGDGVGRECFDKARAAMPLGQDWTFFTTLVKPDGKSPPRPVQDSRVVAATSSWAACMAAAGYRVTDPVAAMLDPRWMGEAGRPSATQIAQAKADLACKQQTNLVGVGMAVLRAYDESFVEQHRPALESYRSAINDFLKAR